MCAQFSDTDVGKTVVNANGTEVGIVTTVEHGTAHVEPDPSITDTIKAALGWGSRDQQSYPLQEAAVERVTDDEIRLVGDLRTGHESGAGSEPESRADAEHESGAHSESAMMGTNTQPDPDGVIRDDEEDHDDSTHRRDQDRR